MLTRPIKDRVENDPRPVNLQTPCDRDEVVKLIGRRLKFLFDQAGCCLSRRRAHIPAPRGAGSRLVGLRAATSCSSASSTAIAVSRKGRWPTTLPG